MSEGPDERFSLVIGGPFYRLQRRLGLLGPDLLPPASTALLFATVAWLPPAVLSVVEGTASQATLVGQAFFLDFGAYARFLISIAMFVMMERIAEKRIALLIHQFHAAGLVPPDERSRFALALQRADRRSSSSLAETILLGIAIAAAANALHMHLSVLQTTWIGSLADGQVRLSAAGWWTALVSFPLFWFLLLRWLWRFVVWTMLLRDLARLDLNLVATHPDRSGGIGFLGLFPPTFTAFAFALSCVSAAAALKEIVFAGVPLEAVGLAFGAWLAAVMVIFVGPLAVFALPLLRLRRQALLDYGTLASNHNRAFERKWVDQEARGEDALGAQEISSLADLATGFALVRSMRLIPLVGETVWPLLVATALPWLGVAMTRIPLAEILRAMARALL